MIWEKKKKSEISHNNIKIQRANLHLASRQDSGLSLTHKSVSSNPLWIEISSWWTFSLRKILGCSRIPLERTFGSFHKGNRWDNSPPSEILVCHWHLVEQVWRGLSEPYHFFYKKKIKKKKKVSIYDYLPEYLNDLFLSFLICLFPIPPKETGKENE